MREEEASALPAMIGDKVLVRASAGEYYRGILREADDGYIVREGGKVLLRFKAAQVTYADNGIIELEGD
jgi:hypothetical protein